MVKKIRKSKSVRINKGSVKSENQEIKKFVIDSFNQLRIAHQHDFTYHRKAVQSDMKSLEEKMDKSFEKVNEKFDRLALKVTENTDDIREIKKEIKSWKIKLEPLENLMEYLDKKFALLESWNQEKDLLGNQVDRANADNRVQDNKLENHDGRIGNLECI